MRIKNYVGLKFGRLTVLEKTISHKDSSGRTRTFLKCRCDCGNEKEINAYSVTSGEATSCGCYRIEKPRIAFGKASFNRLYIGYLNNAKKRNLIWDLTKDRFYEITQENCYYCGKPPSQTIVARGNNGNFVYSGIDRIDSSKGYEKDNIVACCARCNQAKMSETKDNFINWIKQVYEHLHLG